MASSGCVPEEDTQNSQLQECETEEKSDNANAQPETQNDGNSDVYHSDNSEFGLEDCDPEGWEDVESEDPEDEGGDEDTEEVDFIEME